MIIENTKRNVFEFKNIGYKPLRFFPGYNEVDDETFGEHIKTPICAAIAKENFRIIKDTENLSFEDFEKASKAKEKNDEMNKSLSVIKVQEEQLASKDKQIQERDETIMDLVKKVEALEKKIGGKK